MANTLMAQPVFTFATLQMMRDRLVTASKIGATINVRRPARFDVRFGEHAELLNLSPEDEFQITRLNAEKLRCKNRLKEMSLRANYGAVAYGADMAADEVNAAWQRLSDRLANNLADQMDSIVQMGLGWIRVGPTTLP